RWHRHSPRPTRPRARRECACAIPLRTSARECTSMGAYTASAAIALPERRRDEHHLTAAELPAWNDHVERLCRDARSTWDDVRERASGADGEDVEAIGDVIGEVDEAAGGIER